MEKLPIIIHRFYTRYVDDQKNPGRQTAVDMVEYGPIGQAQRTHAVERVDVLSRVQKSAGANPAIMMAGALWNHIKPRYEAWKTNQELPEAGTPLAAWNHLTPEQGQILRTYGVRSIEEVALLTDAHIQRFPIPNLRSIIEAAKKFMDASDVNKFTAEMKQKDETIAALTARLDQLAEMVAAQQEDAPKRRGRPPNPPKEEAA